MRVWRPFLSAVVFGLVAVLGLASRSAAQSNSLTITPTYNSPFYTAAFQGAINSAASYISTQFDARGTIDIKWNAADQGFSSTGGFPLANCGTAYFSTPGFSNGIAFGQATTGDTTSFPTGNTTGTFNSNSNINWYTGSVPPGPPVGQIDMQSIALHEMTHALAFSSLIRSNGAGLFNHTPGTADTYGRFGSFLTVGSASNAPHLVNSDGTFNTSQTAGLTSNNVFFQGEMATAANGGTPVKIFAPSPFAQGSSLSHLDNTPAGVMLPSISDGVSRRAYTNVDLGILIDIGWNQFVWKNNTGNWADNVSSTATPQWQNLDGDDMLSPVGTITPNLVLRFGGTGGYTSTNNLTLTSTGNRFLANRIILNATAGTSTIQSDGTNVLRFGTTIGVAPLIRQDGAGAFNISHPIELTNSNLQLGGDGTGTVTLSGTISAQVGQTGGITKIGGSTFVLTGNNTYNGPTSVTAGTLLVNGQTLLNSGTGSGAVSVSGTGRLGGNGRIGGSLSATGGTVAPGDATTPGTLTVGGGVTFNSSSIFAVRLNGNTVGGPNGYDQMVVESGTVALNNAMLSITRAGTYTPGANDRLVILINSGLGATTGQFAGLDPGVGVTINSVTYFAYYNYDSMTGQFGIGNDVVLVFTPVPVPEPLTVLGLAAGGLGLARFVRRGRARLAA